MCGWPSVPDPGFMNDNLHDSLEELLRSGSTTNPALNVLLRDYARYHVVFIVVGGLSLVGFLLLAASSWRRFRKMPKGAGRRWSFERATYAGFGAASAFLAMVMAALVAANVSNAVDPRQGLTGAVDLVGAPTPDTETAGLHHAFATWLRSGRSETPSVVDERVDGRLAWQRPKALICLVLLLVIVLVSARIWRTLVRRSRRRTKGWGWGDRALLVAGLGAGPVALVLMAMVIGNTQGSLAPISLTLFYG